MPKVPPRTQMVITAARLFQRNGYCATSWRKLVGTSGAPWGSTQHYFPGGKEQLGVEAIELAGANVARLIEASFANTGSPGEAIQWFFSNSAGRLSKSGFRDGCPVTTVALETVPGSRRMSTACAAAFSLWRDTFARGFIGCGLDHGVAQDWANTVLASFIGALVLARVQQSIEPLDRAATHVSLSLRSAPA
jgi:TetR/AcrR family transcriptional regulator, lmrAB and yxaGH operons repressor